MTTRHQPVRVGSSDPELKTSPILEERDEEYNVLAQEVEEQPACYFNSVAYPDGTYACSGSGILLHCDKGIWIRQGGCDPDNP